MKNQDVDRILTALVTNVLQYFFWFALSFDFVKFEVQSLGYIFYIETVPLTYYKTLVVSILAKN